MEITDIIGIGLVGTLVSSIIQLIKNTFGVDSLTSKILVIMLSIVLGTIYFFLRDTAFLGTVVAILMVSQTIYGLFK